MGDKVKYVPNQTKVTSIIEKIRAEFLEEGVISDDTIILSALLDRSGIIKNYFSKVETAKLKERLEEIKNNESYTMIKKILDDIVAVIVVVSS